MHKFQQVLRDFNNALMCSHEKTLILIDDTLPSDVFSTLVDANRAHEFRKISNTLFDYSWHGDVFKIVFYIQAFLTMLSFMIFNSENGNAQTLVYRKKRVTFKPRYSNLELIERLTYFDLVDNIDIFNLSDEKNLFRNHRF